MCVYDDVCDIKFGVHYRVELVCNSVVSTHLIHKRNVDTRIGGLGGVRLSSNRCAHSNNGRHDVRDLINKPRSEHVNKEEAYVVTSRVLGRMGRVRTLLCHA